MKRYTIALTLLLALINTGCEDKTVVAASGDPMWVILNHVKADKRQQFEEFAYEVAKLYGLKRITLFKTSDVEDKAYSILSEDFIAENHVIPFSLTKDTIKVAISDPAALSVMGNVKVLSSRQVETFVVTFKEVKDIITKRSNIQFGSASGLKNKDVEEDKEESSEIIRYVNQIIEIAISEGASDIHIEPFRNNSRLRYRIDGVLNTQSEKLMTGFSVSSESSFLHEHYAAVTTRVKIMATLDISEKRLPQDGAIIFKAKKTSIDLRISVLPTNNGERVVMRILDKGAISIRHRYGLLEILLITGITPDFPSKAILTAAFPTAYACFTSTDEAICLAERCR